MADRPAPAQRSMPQPRIIVAAIIGVLLLWFAILNRTRVEINFIIFKEEVRLIYIIIGSAVLGAIAGALVRHRRRERRRDQRRGND